MALCGVILVLLFGSAQAFGNSTQYSPEPEITHIVPETPIYDVGTIPEIEDVHKSTKYLVKEPVDPLTPAQKPVYSVIDIVPREQFKTLPVRIPETLEDPAEEIPLSPGFKTTYDVLPTSVKDKSPLTHPSDSVYPVTSDLSKHANQVNVKTLDKKLEDLSIDNAPRPNPETQVESYPKIVVTPPEQEATNAHRSSHFLNTFQFHQKSGPIQNSFQNFRNSVPIQQLPLSNPPQFFTFLRPPSNDPKPEPYRNFGPYEQEFQERINGQGKYIPDKILSNNAVKITKLIGDLKQTIKSVLLEFVEEDSNGKNGIEICKLSQTRLVLTATADAFFNSIGHFVKLDSGDGDADCRFKAYRALRTLQDALEGIRGDIPQRAAIKLEQNWIEIGSAISGTINSLTGNDS